MGGIYVLLGIGVEVRDNRVLRNGDGTKRTTQVKAGVAIELAVPPAAPDDPKLGGRTGYTLINHNIVTYVPPLTPGLRDLVYR